jgi:hypothetical protein
MNFEKHDQIFLKHKQYTNRYFKKRLNYWNLTMEHVNFGAQINNEIIMPI